MSPLEGMALFNLFCDDIRHEEGGRNTYVGCYRSSTVALNEDKEVELPTLACLVVLKGPASTSLQNAELVLQHSGYPGEDMILPLASQPASPSPNDPEEDVNVTPTNKNDHEGKMVLLRATARLSGIAVWPGIKINSVLRLNGTQIRGNPLIFVSTSEQQNSTDGRANETASSTLVSRLT